MITLFTNLQIQMHNKILVHVVDSLTDLPHKQDTVSLCEVKVVGHHSLKQLTASDAERGDILDDSFVSIHLSSK